MPRPEISLADARRLALAVQGCHRPRPGGVHALHLRARVGQGLVHCLPVRRRAPAEVKPLPDLSQLSLRSSFRAPESQPWQAVGVRNLLVGTAGFG